LVRNLRRKDWIVFSKPPFSSPEHVLAYLGRYAHRVATANSRLISATRIATCHFANAVSDLMPWTSVV
jgi:hypothetical protein